MSSAPGGYTRFLVAGAEVVAVTPCAAAVRHALASGSLYTYAATHPARRALRGRAAAYAVPLPDGGTRVVVRHSQHGGLLAPVTGDRFLAPTRAPHELGAALRLAASGVATPEVIAYATYPAGPFLRRSDVATREIVGGQDLARVLATDDRDARTAAFAAVVVLLRDLERAGARHPDLNAANVLIVPAANSAGAFVLDVDRVVFAEPGDRRVGAANIGRLLRSLRKLRGLARIVVTDAELDALAVAAGNAA